MSTMTKVFVVLNSILTIALSCVFVSAAAQWDNWRQVVRSYEESRDNAIQMQQAEQAASAAALALKEEARAAAQRSLEQAQKDLVARNEELARARSDRAKAENEKTRIEATATSLRDMLDVRTAEATDLRKRNQDLLTRNNELEERYTRGNSRILELTTNVTILTDQIRNLQEKLYAAEQGGARLTSTARPISSAAPITAVAAQPGLMGPIRGSVTTVDGAYASVNIGEASGVTVGMEFMVYRDSTYLGMLKIETVGSQEAAGKLAAQAAGQVRSGDMIVFGLN